MLRRLALLVIAPLAVTAGLALAQGGSQYEIPEPAVTASKTLRLPPARSCSRNAVRLNLLPPTGVEFSSLSVRAGDKEVLQLAALAGPGSLRVTLPRGRTRVRVSATTSGGRFVQAARTYHRCRADEVPTARPKPGKGGGGGAPITGGGED